MKNRLIIAVLAISVVQIAMPANAQPRNEVGRYSMHKTDDGFIRLDTLTGAVSICRKTDDDWSCRPMPDEARKLRAEIDSLRARNDELARRLAARGGELPKVPGPYHPDNGQSEQKSFRLPSEAEVDKALDYFERLMKKFQDRLNKLERKSSPEKDKKL